MKKTAIAAAAALLALPLAPAVRADDAPVLFYVGSYAPATQEGISVFQLDPKSGALTRLGGVTGVENPSFVALDSRGKYLFAVGETDGPAGGSVTSFSLADPKAPVLLNSQSAKGGGTCYVSVDHAGKNVLVANYGGGSVAVLPFGGDGRLSPATAFVQDVGSSGVVASRQKAPYAHSITPDPADRYAIAADLGADKLYVYKYDAKQGTLTPNDPAFCATAPGAGPRHFAFHPNGKWAYGTDELNATVAVYSYDAKKGVLTPVQAASTLPAGVDPVAIKNTTSEIQIHPSGKFVYAGNRGHNSIAGFAVDGKTGNLTSIGNFPTQGKTPRNFCIDPSGQFMLVANQDSDSLVLFRIDTKTGALTPAGQTATVSKPVCIRFLPKQR